MKCDQIKKYPKIDIKLSAFPMNLPVLYIHWNLLLMNFIKELKSIQYSALMKGLLKKAATLKNKEVHTTYHVIVLSVWLYCNVYIHVGMMFICSLELPAGRYTIRALVLVLMFTVSCDQVILSFSFSAIYVDLWEMLDHIRILTYKY